MTRFQLIFTGLLVALGIAGVIVFAVSKNNSSQGAPQVVLWGTIDNQLMSTFLSTIMPDNRDTINVSYVQKSPMTLESELVAALARGSGPDLILLPQDLIIKQMDKFYAIPFSSYSTRAFKDAFIQEGELYLTTNGIIGLPFTVDPMVMYWNRDIFTNAGVAQPPTSWTQFFELAPKMTVKDKNGNIVQSTIAFGQSKNITHFKDILALLSMQAGTPIVSVDSQGGLVSQFAARGSGLVPAEEAVSYFTEFSNPLKTSYSWNGAMANDRSVFIGGKLAVYFGYASELRGIRAANPNLNFDVTMMPQTDGKKMTFGSMNALAVLKASKNLAAAYIAAVALTSQPIETEWARESGLPPVRRALLATLPGDAYNAVFYKSALIANAWLDPNREVTTNIFAALISNATSGALRVSGAVTQASQQIDSLLRSN